MSNYRYYSTQRPVGPMTFPMPEGNRVMGWKNFNDRQDVPDIGRPAWGWIEYEKPLTEAEARSYELVKGWEDREVSM